VLVKPSHVEGLSSDSDIAQAFADHFKQPFVHAPLINPVYINTEVNSKIDVWLLRVVEKEKPTFG